MTWFKNIAGIAKTVTSKLRLNSSTVEDDSATNQNMDNDTPRLIDIWEVSDDCEEKLRKTKSAIQNGNRQFLQIDTVVAECAETNTDLALEVIDTLARNSSVLANQIRESLRAISEADPTASLTFFDNAIGNSDYDREFIAGYAAHLFWEDTDALCDQLEEWYSSSPQFFESTVEQTLGQYHKERQTYGELGNRDERILEILVEIAENEGLDVSGALNADTNDKLVTSSLVLDDLRALPSSLDTYGISVDYGKIDTNGEDYPHLTNLLGNNWKDNLKGEGVYELPSLFSHEVDRSDFYATRRSFEKDSDIEENIRYDLASAAKLIYLDHCCEVINVDQERTKSLRTALLDREKYRDGLAELEVINALRREFVDCDVMIEPSVAGKKPDLRIDLGDRRLWVEVTTARESTQKRLVGVFSAPSGEDSKVRDKVTRKTRGQISAIKEEHPNDLTMVVLKNEFSSIDDNIVREYALGEVMLMLRRIEENPEIYALPGEPIAKKDDHTKNPDDEGIEHLDILVNYSGAADFYTKPYLTGQVFSFSESVSDQLLNRIGQAFNADSAVYRTEFR